jgi:tetratricopeptide (TPR) repeat protein
VLAGREEGAIKAEEESLAIYRELATARPIRFRPKLASALNNFSDDLRQWNRLDAAVTTAMESVALYRALSETAEEYLKQRVLPLENLVLALQRSGGREQDQERVLRELEEVHEQLASKSPATPDPKRLWALSTQALLFTRLSRHEEAIGAYQKAVEVARQHNSSEHQKRALAAFLHDLAANAIMAGQHDKSLPALRESIEILRALASDAPGRHELELGLGLNSLAALLYSREEWGPACDARKEGLQYLAAVLAVAPVPDALAVLPSYLESYRQEAVDAGMPVDEALLARLGAHLSAR